MRNILVSLLLSAFWILSVSPAYPEEDVSSSGYGDLPVGSIELAHGFLRDEARRARRSALVWGLAGVASAGYVGAGISGLARQDPVLTALSYVGLLAGPVGVFQGTARRRHVMRLRSALKDETADCAGPLCRLSWVTGNAVLEEMRARRVSLTTAATSGLRAGCVIPVVLSGIALYGFSTKTRAGDDLAGLSIGASLAIAVPALLRYWGAKRRLGHLYEIIGTWEKHSNKVEDK